MVMEGGGAPFQLCKGFYGIVMNKITISIITLSVFYSGFYLGGELSSPTVITKTNPVAKIQKQANKINLLKTKGTTKRSGQTLNNNISYIEEDLRAPHKIESTEEERQEQKNQFILNQDTEVELFETMLVSMKENNFPETEIADIEAEIDDINSQKFDDNKSEHDDYDVPMTSKQLRDDLTESLKLAGDISDEDIDKMVYSMFPDEDESDESISIEDDSSILFYEDEN